jgi:hypothetical protein
MDQVEQIDARLVGSGQAERGLEIARGDVSPLAGTGGEDEDSFQAGVLPLVNNL